MEIEFFHWRFEEGLLIVYIAILAIATVSYKVIEEPGIRLTRWLTRRLSVYWNQRKARLYRAADSWQ